MFSADRIEIGCLSLEFRSLTTDHRFLTAFSLWATFWFCRASPTQCRSGGTGRRTGLKIPRPSRAWGFDPPLRHHLQTLVPRALAPIHPLALILRNMLETPSKCPVCVPVCVLGKPSPTHSSQDSGAQPASSQPPGNCGREDCVKRLLGFENSSGQERRKIGTFCRRQSQFAKHSIQSGNR